MSTATVRSCPSEADLVRFSDGELDGAKLAEVSEHLGECLECRELVALAAGDSEPSASADDAPTFIGRYRLTGVLGSGAMGIVHAAEDPELGRTVAIKRVYRWEAQLVREARAMAMVSHPNVVPVFDVGESGGRPYIVMALVDGPDLRQWAKGRSSRELLDCFIACGRGLAAAHEVGLVHRDVKPSNVLVDGDGCPKVTDFGLVGAPEGPARDRTPLVQDGDMVRTRSGLLVGTPAYMSPEQFSGVELSAATDQFSFCVALTEALCGERPTSGKTIEELAASSRTAFGRVERLSGFVAAPVVEAIRRGLAPHPSDRFPSMDALVAQLESTPAPRRRWGRAGAAVLGLTLCGAVVASFTLDPESTSSTNGEARPPLFLRPAVARLDARLAAVRQEIDEADYDEAMRLLEHDAQALDEMPWTPTWVDGQLLRATCEGVRGERGPQRTRLRRAHYRAAAAGYDRRAAMAATALIEAHASGAGDYTSAEHWFTVAASTARRLDDPILEAEAVRRAAFVAMQTSRFDDALALVARASSLLRSRPDATVETRMADLDGIRGYVGLLRGEMDTAQRAFSSQLRRLDNAYGAMHPKRAPVLLGLIQVALERRAWDEAEDLIETRREVVLASFGSASVQYGRNLAQRGRLDEGRGDIEAALVHAKEARDVFTNALGPHHPDVARQQARIGELHAQLGHLELALQAYRRALDDCVEFSGEESSCAVHGHTNIGLSLSKLGRDDQARDHLRSALSLSGDVLGPDHPASIRAAVGLGGLHLRTGALDDARALFRSVLARTASSPRNANLRGRAAFLLAQALLADPDHDRAAELEADALVRQGLGAWDSIAATGVEVEQARLWAATRSGTAKNSD